MNRPEKLFHGLFFLFTLIWLSALLFYQDLGRLRYRTPALADPLLAADETKIKVVCDPVCFFMAEGKRIMSRTDSDSAAGLPKVILRFYDPYHGLIGYEDVNPYPNFFVIDTRGEFLQAIRLRLPQIGFAFEAYYPGEQLIRFKSDNGKKYFYAANKPELTIQ